MKNGLSDLLSVVPIVRVLASWYSVRCQRERLTNLGDGESSVPVPLPEKESDLRSVLLQPCIGLMLLLCLDIRIQRGAAHSKIVRQQTLGFCSALTGGD